MLSFFRPHFVRALPPSRVFTTFRPRNASNWTKHTKYPSFFSHTPIPRFQIGRKALWLIPIAGGVALTLTPEQKSFLPGLFSSPTIIPCPPPRALTSATIMSPSELDMNLTHRVKHFFLTRIWEPLLTGKRFIWLLILFMPIIVSAPMLLVGKPDKRLHGDRWGAIWWYDYFVLKMQQAGPTFIKLAQWAGSRADLFPTEFCHRLGRLHSNGHPHSIEHTKSVISKVFRKPFDELFEEFDETPIGTGAIAQVYRAVLKHDLLPPSYLGPRRPRKINPANALTPQLLQDPPPSAPTASVAIKVLHPRVSKTISRDLSIMAFFAHLVTLVPGMQWISLPEEVEVFGEMMFQQLDLRHEADNLLTFEHNFAPRRVPVTFPRPLKAWSTKELLIEEFQDAVPMEIFLKNGGGPYDTQMATVGLDAFLNMLLLDNFVHSDLHPGNIMIKFTKQPTTRHLLKNIWESLETYIFTTTKTKGEIAMSAPDYSDSNSIVSRLRSLSKDRSAWLAELSTLYKEGYMPEVVFIDAGLVTTLSATNRTNFLDMFRAMAEFDGYRTGQLMVERCRSPELAIDTETFALKMQHLVLTVKRKTFSLGQIKISDILTEVLKSVRTHHVKMEGDFVNTVISILLLEGIGRQLDPGLDLFKSALPILRQLGGQMATREGMTRDLPQSNLGMFLKLWVWLEARELITASIVNADAMIKYDWLSPNV